MKRIILGMAIMMIATAAAAATTFRVDPTNATIGFSVMKWGVLLEEGEFREFTGTIILDDAQPERSRVNFRVRSSSIDTKNSRRDDTLRSPDFIDAKRHPELSFQSTRVVPTSANTAKVTGRLTIRGVTREITIPIRLLGRRYERGVGHIAAFETGFDIDRRHFGVLGARWSGQAPGVLGNTISIRIVAGAISPEP